MSVDKLVDSTQLDSDLTSVANAIRAKTGGSSKLAFPTDFVSEIGNITGGMTITETQDVGGGTIISIDGDATTVEPITITENGTTTAPTGKAYSPVTVDVSGGGYTNDDFADLSKPIGEVTTTRASLPPYFFYQRTGITKFTGDSVTSLTSASYAYCHTFYGCTALQEIVLPKVTALQDKNSVFRGCTSLRKVDLSGVQTLNGTSVFQDCSLLEGIVFPSAHSAAGNAGTTLGSNMFNGCTSLAYFDSAMVYNIQASTFTNCASLAVVVIRYSPNTSAGNVSALANVSAFNGTPFASGGSGGTLYVPSAKITAYEAATNWSTILGYANNQIKAIEGSYYETHYADGTEIPT